MRMWTAGQTRSLVDGLSEWTKGFDMDRMLQFFAYEHLPPHLQEVSKRFGDLARWMVETLPSNAERTAGLRKLLESKDCAVRARLYREPESPR
jgi:hypothetical protein